MMVGYMSAGTLQRKSRGKNSSGRLTGGRFFFFPQQGVSSNQVVDLMNAVTDLETEKEIEKTASEQEAVLELAGFDFISSSLGQLEKEASLLNALESVSDKGINYPFFSFEQTKTQATTFEKCSAYQWYAAIGKMQYRKKKRPIRFFGGKVIRLWLCEFEANDKRKDCLVIRFNATGGAQERLNHDVFVDFDSTAKKDSFKRFCSFNGEGEVFPNHLDSNTITDDYMRWVYQRLSGTLRTEVQINPWGEDARSMVEKDIIEEGLFKDLADADFWDKRDEQLHQLGEQLFIVDKARIEQALSKGNQYLSKRSASSTKGLGVGAEQTITQVQGNG